MHSRVIVLALDYLINVFAISLASVTDTTPYASFDLSVVGLYSRKQASPWRVFVDCCMDYLTIKLLPTPFVSN
jgi:hypothetical protein